MDGLLGSAVPEKGSEPAASEPAEPDGCTRPVFRVASRLDAERIAAMREHRRVVLVFGPGISAEDVAASLEAMLQHAPHTACPSIVLAAEEQLAGFQELIDADRLFYLSRTGLSDRDLNALIDSALALPRVQASLDRYLTADQLRRIALAQSVAELADALRAAMSSAVDAERTRCLLYDSERQILWAPNDSSDGYSAAAGVVSFIHRTGLTVTLPRLGDDARYDLDLDNPGGESADRFLGVAVRAGRGEIIAVLTALRPTPERAFEPLEIAALETVAAHASPYLAAWLVEPEETASPFRRRALRELEQPLSAGPEPLRLESHWMRAASWLVAAVFVALLLALVFVRVPRYATGTALVRHDGAVIATFPARTPLQRGMPLRFNNQSLPIESVAGTTVVTAKLPRSHAGTRGKAEVRVGTERLLFALTGERR